MNNKIKLVSFDMDGTLTYGTTCLQYYLKMLGKEEKAKELEYQYKNHEISDDQVADCYADILKGTTTKQLEEWTANIPRMKNIDKTVSILKEIGLIVGITSVGPSFASEIFQTMFGFDFTSGSDHQFIGGVHAGKMVKTLTGNDKLVILEGICKKNMVCLSEVVAVGDSRSDIPIFEKVGFRIALNADESLQKETDIFIKSDNLLDVSKVIKNNLIK